ncbi:MAG TPA: fatty acid--CoA ligase family protein [Herbaspirillum sp.]|jgi:acyl-coenzyme A synthetase/AMP-(fatty) acid ligase
MSSLLERVATMCAGAEPATQRIALQTANGAVSYDELILLAQRRRAQHDGVRGKSLALEYDGLLDFCVGLLAFDGWCSALWLSAPQLSPAERAQHGRQIGCRFGWRSGDVHQDEMAPTSSDIAAQDDTGTQPVTRWWLTTSGTSGSPKLIGHTLAGLSGKIRVSAFSRSLCWGLVYLPYRFAGLQVVLQALLSGATLVDAQGPEPDQRIAAMVQHDVTALSATPSLWRSLLMTGRLAQLGLRQLTLGGEIADQALLTWLRRLFPQAKLLHIYASTEAGVGFTVADGRDGFPTAWLTSENSAAPLPMRIDARQHLLVRPAAGVMTGIDAARIDADGFLDTEDLVCVENDRVHFLGRAGGVINVGGNKVHPEQVEQVILDVPGIVQVRVYGKRSSVLGQLVAADVVAAEPERQAALQATVMQHCLRHLARYQIPAKFNWVTSIHAGESGKMTRD